MPRKKKNKDEYEKEETIDIERGKRLRELRTSKRNKFTQLQLYYELQKVIVEDEGGQVQDYDDGGRVISKLEAGRSLSLRNAIAYSKYFNVSLDYLYGVSKYKKPGYKETTEVLGFSEDALRHLEILNKTNDSAIRTLNKFLSPKLFPVFKELIDDYSEHALLDIKEHIMNYSGTVRYNNTSVSPLFLKYINLDAKGLESLSKTTISDCSKKLADELRKFGDNK